MLANAGLYAALGGAAAAAVLGLFARSKSTRLLPMLARPPEDAEVTRGDRLRYYGAHFTALLLGVSAAAALDLVATPAARAHTYRVTDGVGRLLGPFFLTLSVGAATSPVLLGRFVRPAALQALLWRAARRAGHKDPRPLSLRLGLVVMLLALALHVALGGVFLRLGERGVSWRSQPFQSEQVRDWSALRSVELVRTFAAMTGRVVERPHLRLRFTDGAVVDHGRADARPLAVWEEAAAYASERAGVEVRRVDK